MPTKTSKKTVAFPDGRPYEIDGKKLTWHPVDDNGGAGNLPDVTIPLRLKLKVIRSMVGREMDADVMIEILDTIIPEQAATLDEMDIATDFQLMFETWQDEYNQLAGVNLGESQR